jgi:hypothetical protein
MNFIWEPKIVQPDSLNSKKEVQFPGLGIWNNIKEKKRK